MPAFIEGHFSLAQGVQDVTVAFPASSFNTVPELVLPIVENTTDNSIQLISAFPTAKTQNDFTVHLSAAPPSANYVLRYFAGSNTAIYGALTGGKKLSAYQQLLVGLLDSDYMMVVHTAGGALQTVRVPISAFKALFVPRGIAVPTSPASPGVAGQLVVSSKYIYTHDGVQWGQTARVLTNWQSDP